MKKRSLFSFALLTSFQIFGVEVDLNSEDFYTIEANQTELHEGISLFIHDERYFTPIKSFLHALEINFKQEGDTFTGWVFEQENTFALSLNNNNSFTYDDTLYFDAKTFCEELSIEFTDDPSDGVMRLTSKNLFLYQLKGKLANRNVSKKQEIHDIDIHHEYNAITPPNLKIDTNFISNDKGNEQSASISYKGDIGYSSLAFNAYTDNETSEITQVKVSKISESKKSKLYFSSIEAGDIQTSSNHHITSNLRGKGIALYKRKENTNSFHNKETIDGHFKPNYLVELYQNDTLVDTTKTNSSGYYKFLNNPLFIGRNTFTLMFYGEHGDIHKEKRSYSVTGQMLRKGEHNLNMHFLNTTSSVGGEELSNIGDVFNIDIAYGLTNTSTYGFGITHLLNENSNTYFSSALTQTISETSNTIELLSDGHEWGGTFRSLGTIGGINYSIHASEYSKGFNFENEQQKDKLTIAISKHIRLDNDFLKNISLFYNSKNTKEEGGSFTSQKAGINLSFKDLNARYYIDMTEGLQTNEIRMSTSLLGYRLKYEQSSNTVKENYLFEISKIFNGYSFRLKNEIDTKLDTETYSLNVDKYFDTASIRGYAQKSKNNTEFGLNISTNIYWNKKPKLTRRPLISSGTIKTIAFIDENYNEIKDPSEPPVKGIAYENHPLWEHIRSGEDGVAFLPGVSHMTNKSVYVDVNSIDDFSLMPPEKTFIQTHAGGVTTALMPFKRKKILEMNLFSANEKPLKYAKITLKSERQEITGFTDSEGYFYNEEVFPGNFTITLNENNTRQAKLEIPNDKNTEEYYFNHLVLREH